MTRGWVEPASRLLTVAAVVVLVGLLPWLTGVDPAIAVLRARSAEQAATPEAVAAVREQLGLDRGPWSLLGGWLSGLARGDAGTSWVSGRPVLPGMLEAFAVSLTLMGFAALVATAVAALATLPTLRRGLAGHDARTSGWGAVALTALPEFLLAAGLLVVVAVGLGWLPPYGWRGPSYAVLPALALGVPAGGLMGRLLADGLATTFTEPWVLTWQVSGAGRMELVRGVLRRTAPGLTGQLALTLVGLTGGAIAVEKVFAVPGLGRATLGAAVARDVPSLQVGLLFLLALALALGALAGVARRALLGSVLATGQLSRPVRRRDARPHRTLPALTGGALLLLLVAGLGRDPYAAAHPRLAPPSAAAPFGADAAGRDLLARVAHGALTTTLVALGVVAVCLVVGVLVGLLPRWGTGPIEVANALPPVVAGLLVAAVSGPSVAGAAVAVAVTGWAPLAAHTAATAAEVRGQPHVRIAPVLGVGRARLLTTYVLPGVAGPVTRHALLRLPGIALALAGLGFLGLGPQPPRPEWGLVLAEGLPYAERAPWAVAGPALALVVLSVLAVSLAQLGRPRGLAGSTP